jgi:4,5-DOPA dioxygenase extradiol
MSQAGNPGRMPVLFVGHGNPMNAIEDNEFHRAWRRIASRLPRPAAILCVAAHWETRGVWVSAAERPATIHDFYGFPKALFEAEYPVPGDPLLARRTVGLLAAVGARACAERGLDHGAWSVLMAMYPEADLPVVQLSLDTRQPGSFHYRLARQLAPLRDQGVLVVGSGNIVHNLALFSFQRHQPFPWAARWDDEVRQRLLNGEDEELVAYESLGSDARLAVPTAEHYLPLLYAIALRAEGEGADFFNQVVMSSLSMTSVLIGASG